MVVLSPQHGGNAAFFSNFPLAESITKEFCWLFLWNFKEKSINHFLWHSLSELFLTMPIYVCPPLASVSGDTGTSPHPFRGFCCWRHADGVLGGHPIRFGQRRRHRRHRHHGTPGTHPLRQTREAAQPGQSGLRQRAAYGKLWAPRKSIYKFNGNIGKRIHELNGKIR